MATFWTVLFIFLMALDTSRMYQRVQIQFMMKLGMSAHAVSDHLRRAHGNLALSLSSIYRWMKKFRAGRDGCADAKRSGRPTKITPDKIQQITLLLNGDRTLSVRHLSTLTHLGMATVHKALRTVMKLKKRPSTWVPHDLTADQRRRRVETCRRLMRIKAGQRNLIDNIVTGDESWILAYDPETKQASAQWLNTSDKCAPKPRVELRTQKVMLVVFFDSAGVIHREFIPRGLGVGGVVYLAIMVRLRHAIRRKRPDMWRRHQWWLQHDGAPAHRADPVVRYLHQQGTRLLPHPGYSPDIAPADYWFFDRVKKHLRGRRFRDTDELCHTVDTVIAQIPPAEFAAAMARLVPRWRECIHAQGHYFE